MHEPYRYETLPPGTPDDDPRWTTYLDVFRQGFLDRRGSAAGLDIYRRCRRADAATLGMVTTEGPGLDDRVPVGAFVSAPFTLNDGHGPVPVEVINTIAVRASHRRRGLLTEMMRQHLDAAVAQGRALAALTASEGTIYRRYGFGVATRSAEIHVDTARFALRDDVAVAGGSVEFVDPAFLTPHFERIRLAHQARYRGAHGIQEAHRLIATGTWDSTEEGASRSLRALVHFGADGVPDGFATFVHRGWDSTPITTSVRMVCSPDPAVDRALWRVLASIDLVQRLEYGLSHPGDPLAASLKDPWAVETKETSDAVWLRVLDLPAAMAGRRFEADGEVRLGITDRAGYCDGAWLLRSCDGRSVAEPSTQSHDVELDVSTLAMLWLGDRTAAELALSGLVTGSTEAVATLSRLFSTAEPPVNLSQF